MHLLYPVALALAASASTAAPLDTFRDCDVCPEMIELPMGEFVMGATPSELSFNVFYRDGTFQLATRDAPYFKEDEAPQRKVTVDIPIAMGKNEVTYGEWMACVADGGCNGYVPENRVGACGSEKAVVKALTDKRFNHLPSNKAMLDAVRSDRFLRIDGRYPVLRVDYEDAQAYVAWLNRKLGTDAYRLPTEAEWEYAARAGTTTRFAQGFEPSPDQANISGEWTELSMQEDRPDLRSLPFPVPVDEMDAANAWGLRHMSGNAGEITQSCYTPSLPAWPATSAWLKGSSRDNCDRVVRGGRSAAQCLPLGLRCANP